MFFNIQRWSLHDGPGIRTTVFFQGCPLRCRWCSNPESWEFKKQEKSPSMDVVLETILKDAVFYRASGGGVTFSGGEPFAQPEFLSEILKRCKNCGIHTALDTTCYVERNVLELVVQDVDLFLCDIKHMDSKTHERFTGVGNELILDNIKWLSSLNSAIVIRFPVIAGFNDDAGNIRQMAEFISSLVNVNRVDILPYNPGGLEKSARFCAEYDIMESEIVAEAMLEQIADKLREFALDVKIGG